MKAELEKVFGENGFLQDAFDDEFDFFGKQFSNLTRKFEAFASKTLSYKVIQENDISKVKICLPGLAKDNIEVSFEKDEGLKINVKNSKSEFVKDGDYLIRCGIYGDEEIKEGVFENGVLSVEFKTENLKNKKKLIAIK